jgi:hypothetical protein
MANSQAISAKVSGDYREYSRFRETRAGDPVRSPLRAEGSSRRTDKLQQMIRADVTKLDSLSGSGRPPAAIRTGREQAATRIRDDERLPMVRANDHHA